MTETGSIKFRMNRLSRTVPTFSQLDEVNSCRQELLRAGLLGRDENGIGFGNISVRVPGQSGFHITASGAGDRSILEARDIVLVTGWNIATNEVEFSGAADPSSESMTHAAIYESDAQAAAVIHAHNQILWNLLSATGAVTSGSADYGTPAMAAAVKQYLSAQKERENLFAMDGHSGGILCCGQEIRAICSLLLTATEKATKSSS